MLTLKLEVFVRDPIPHGEPLGNVAVGHTVQASVGIGLRSSL